MRADRAQRGARALTRHGSRATPPVRAPTACARARAPLPVPDSSIDFVVEDTRVRAGACTPQCTLRLGPMLCTLDSSLIARHLKRIRAPTLASGCHTTHLPSHITRTHKPWLHPLSRALNTHALVVCQLSSTSRDTTTSSSARHALFASLICPHATLALRR